MDSLYIITFFLIILIVIFYLINRASINTIETKMITSLNSAKTELANAINTTNISVLKFEGDLNTFKSGNIIPGSNILGNLTKNALETKNFVFLEAELDKIFTSPQDQNKLVFLGIHSFSGINKTGELVFAPLFVSKQKDSYFYFLQHPITKQFLITGSNEKSPKEKN